MSNDPIYRTQEEIDQLNSIYGEKCECCKEKFGPGELTKNDQTGEMLCEDCTRDYERNEFPL